MEPTDDDDEDNHLRRLTVSCGSDKRTYCLGSGDTALLGAAPDNDLVAPFPGVSRRHARLEASADGVLVIDLGSKNGLVSEGRRFENLLLVPGRRVHLGHAVLSLDEVSSSDLDLGLRIDAEREAVRPVSDDRPQDTHEFIDTAALATPAAALRLVRRLGRPDDEMDEREEAAVLDEARRVLGAQWLAELSLDDASGELTAGRWNGPLAGDGVLDAIELTLASDTVNRRGVRRVEASGRFVVVAPGGGTSWLAAAFAGERRPGPSAEELLAFLADRMLAAEGGQVAGEEPPSSDPLRPPPGMVIGDSPAMQDLLHQIRATVKSDLNALITGDTGAGKELVARLIHNSGPSAGGPFLAVNCAAIPGELLEAELFGVAARVATGVDPRPGLFVRADGGTLFLDEIGEMPERLQAKLLRVLQEREVWAVGSGKPKPIRVRTVAASNRDLAGEVDAGRFRRDLYYRLRGLHFHVPPLAERRADLPPLIHALASRAAAKYEKRISGVTRQALDRLLDYDWPGNVRELEYEIERAVLLCPDGGPLEAAHFPALGAGRSASETASEAGDGGGGATADADRGPEELASDTDTVPPPGEFRPLQDRLDEVEREAIQEALAASGGVKSRAADLLSITRNGLAMKMKRLGLDEG
ncbi:MAG TPA: sigma 54-dependent Fis family transcriptional regulator [Thermoanaerobaculia bacterium]|nr:sigma 54-dependent Fis family transcriptional regulator [Thermoanaerobaculia bacterium]